jgi:polysaccharide biosynthesis protein PslH
MALKLRKDRPKILFVTCHWPLAAAYGAQQRVLNVARLLSRFGDVSFVIVPAETEDEETVRRTEQEFEVRKVMRPIRIGARSPVARLIHRFRHEFDPTYMETDGFTVSESDREELLNLIPQYDLVWVHTLRVANWFRTYKWPRTVLDVDNLDSRLYESRVQSGVNLLRRMLNRRMCWIWRRRERLFLERFCVLATCCEDDRRYLGGPERMHVIPNGSHPLKMPRSVSTERPRIGFIGNCTFAPNEEGLQWFIRDVWPLVKREFPAAEMRLVGRESHGYLTKLGPDIVGRGWLEDPGTEIASWSAMIVPIKEGSGTRVKVAEGFARKCPIVATAIGAFGYDVENGKDILLAERAEDFASACISLLENPQLGEALSEKAYSHFLGRWQWESFEGTVGRVIDQCLSMNDCAQNPAAEGWNLAASAAVPRNDDEPA